MPLTPDQRKQLHDALLAAFDEDELRQMLSLNLGLDLDKIVAKGPLTTRVFDLIRWFERRDRVADLIAAAQSYQSEHSGQGAANPQAATTAPLAPQPTAQGGLMPPDPPPPTPKPQAGRKPVPSWLGALLIAVVGGVILLFIEYGWFAKNDDPSPLDATVTATAAAATSTLPSAAPPVSSAGVQTLDIAYGGVEQVTVDGISVVISVPTGGDGSFLFEQIGTVRAMVVANGAQASGRLKIGECLLAGGVMVTLLDTQGGANKFNRFAVARAQDGAACVNR